MTRLVADNTPPNAPNDDEDVVISEKGSFPLIRLLPNMLTLMAMCSGLTAIRYAIMDKWEGAVLAIAIAAIFDVLDGRVARFFKTTSKFGAELDSLADVISFGVAPAMVLYLWAFHGEVGGTGWIASLVYAGCCALRLARFNTMLEDHTAPLWTKSYFTGVPAPAGAGLAIVPLLAVLEFGQDVKLSIPFLSVWLILVGGLMVSRIPTLSMKGRKVPSIWIAPIMALACLVVAALITNPWLSLFSIGVLYLLAIPYGWYSYRRRAKQDQAGN